MWKDLLRTRGLCLCRGGSGVGAASCCVASSSLRLCRSLSYSLAIHSGARYLLSVLTFGGSTCRITGVAAAAGAQSSSSSSITIAVALSIPNIVKIWVSAGARCFK
nr:MAG: hypothetical protein [Cressdnaviricota sp.]